MLHATEALHDFCITCNTSTSGVSEVVSFDFEDIVSIVFLNLTTTLLFHATLFLFKSTTIDRSHPSVSVYINWSKEKLDPSQSVGHRICSKIVQHSSRLLYPAPHRRPAF